MTNDERRFRLLRPWLQTIVKWGGLLAVVGVVVYWVRYSPIPVQTATAKRGTVVAEVMGTGTLEARISSTISPKISGRITQVIVDQGDEVKQGTLLVQLDDEELRQQVSIAEANVAMAFATIVRLKADKDRSTAVFEQAQRHHARVKVLVEKKTTTLEELEQSAESLAVAVSDTARAEAAIAEGQKGLLAAEKTLEYHRARLKDTRIEAPFNGMVVVRHREAGDIAVPASPILTVISTDVLWINAWVDETEMSRLAVGQSVRVVFRSEPDHSFSGEVIRLGRQADRETREFIVDVRVREMPSNWAVGQRAEVYIETDKKEDVLTIPSRFLVCTDQGEGVFVSDNGHSRWKPLKLGSKGQGSVEVLEGLSESDSLILSLDATAQLIEGRRVQLP